MPTRLQSPLSSRSQSPEPGARSGAAIRPVVDAGLRSPGQPLNGATRAFMEPRFGHDFSQVRVHTDTAAARSAQALDALAYTVGRDVVFGAGHYAPATMAGNRLIAHELTHVVQQSGSAAGVQACGLQTCGLQGCGVTDEQHPAEREAESAADAVLQGARARPAIRLTGPSVQRHKDDIVAYGGGQSAPLNVIQAGKLIYTAPAVSGHPGHGENEPSAGPIPTGRYVIHPGITRSTVAAKQSGVCGAAGVGSGFQEITNTDPRPCTGAHYCNVSCPTTAESSRQCFTPVDCWGPMRIKIEGTQAVVTPEGKSVTRDGFYIHGGNASDAVTSGCVKSLDNGVFAEIRKLTGVKGAVPFYVGAACPPSVDAAVTDFVDEATSKVLGPIIDVLHDIF